MHGALDLKLFEFRTQQSATNSSLLKCEIKALKFYLLEIFIVNTTLNIRTLMITLNIKYNL
jgi:hypothetical protein